MNWTTWLCRLQPSLRCKFRPFTPFFSKMLCALMSLNGSFEKCFWFHLKLSVICHVAHF